MRMMIDRQAFCAAMSLGTLVVMPTSAQGQSTIAPLVNGDDPEYLIDPITVGPVAVSPQISTSAWYDDNVIASPDGSERQDVEFMVRPELAASLGNRDLRFELEGFGEFSRFAELVSENSDTYGIAGSVSYSPRTNNLLSLDIGYARQKENRGDPEARDIEGLGPRLFDRNFAIAAYRNQGSRVLLDVEAAIDDINAVSLFDADRDFTTYYGQATVGYRVSGPLYATATGFVSFRDFQLGASPGNPDRDATTYGGQIGIAFVESERLRGRARIGLFRFEPDDPTLDPRNGFSVDAAITYFPRRRAAIILEAFRGDVATFLRGAQARTDTRLSLTGQFELRHNFFARTGIRWIENRFIGSGIKENIYGANFAVEYLANRRLSLVADVNAVNRTSDAPTQTFDRLSVSLTALLRF